MFSQKDIAVQEIAQGDITVPGNARPDSGPDSGGAGLAATVGALTDEATALENRADELRRELLDVDERIAAVTHALRRATGEDAPHRATGADAPHRATGRNR